MKRLTGYLKEKRGMTLVETLTALTILALIIFCFAPLYLSYFDTIKISGEKMKSTYTEAGKIQSLIGGKGTGATSGYESNVSSIPLIFTAPTTTVTRDSVTQTVEQTLVSVRTASNPDGALDPISGSFIFSNPSDIKAGFSTIYTDSINSNIKCFPTSLTDDFVKAYITIVADGFNFANDHMSDLNAYSLYCTKANATNTGSELQPLVFNKDYTLERVSGTQNILLLTLFGGTDVSYENSPLVFKYNNGAYTKEIEVDAPTMIMVGEKASDGKYYYYVSRGETDDDGNLIILRRTMNSKDPRTGKTITLDSAMNDVEWVPADSGDGNNIDANGDKYGYYVMCGDNGQIRRFWRNNATGNYYWGGDYTYYTDINLDRLGGNQYFNGTKTYSTDVSYKFSATRNQVTGKGFNLGSNTAGTTAVNKKTGYLQCNNIWTVTAFGDTSSSNRFYASDGKVYHNQAWKGTTYAPTMVLPYSVITQLKSQYPNGEEFKYRYDGKDYWYRIEVSDNLSSKSTYFYGHEAMTWLKGSDDGYYVVNGLDKSETIPITLTSVDAILITDTSSSGYYDNVNENSYELSGGGTTNLDYPSSSYTLYCGYIPAAMDAWSVDSSASTSYENAVVAQSGGTSYNVTPQNGLERVNSNFESSGMEQYPKWRGTFGIEPYFTTRTTFDVSETGQMAYTKEKAKSVGEWSYSRIYVYYYPYTNLKYALTGRIYDASSPLGNLLTNRTYSTFEGRQQYITAGKVVDVTAAYLSHPMAVHIAANPSDDQGYDMTNDKKGSVNSIHYWNNRRETVTYLDCASTIIPNGDKDIPVSLMVGYVMGGLAEQSSKEMYANTVMNNGIVYIRAGKADIGQQMTENNRTEEYYAKDSTGYKLDAESNVFHQFYYLNSRTTGSDGKEPYRDFVGGTFNHIGNLYGANYWQNNRHIDYVSMNGGEPDTAENKNSGSYNYLRCHPLSNTKVNCVAWGTTWNNNPEAMWGTENGTVLSWWVDLKKAQSESSDKWNDRKVDAELQSYRWIDNVNGKTFAVNSYSWKNSVGAHSGNESNYSGEIFSPDNGSYNEFFDKGSRDLGVRSSIGVISVLDSINDVAYDNDIWVAGGDQSGKAPETYCGNGSVTYGGENVTAFTSRGGGSWIYVRYWVDTVGDKTQSDSNANYLWKAVKISNEAYHNVVQVNNINGMWIATGYIDSNHNGEQDDGERTVVSWATDPLVDVDGHKNHNDSTKYSGGWSEKTVFYEYNGSGGYSNVTNSVGGINSVATRS
ncbi:MAG: hypothetical protein ACI4N4_04965 [Candidatus Fimenecus sp.]